MDLNIVGLHVQMSIYVFVVILLVVQTVNGDQPDVEMYSESVNEDAEMILVCRAKSFNTSGIILNIKKNRCDLLTKEDGVKTSGVHQQKDKTYWRRDYVIVSETEMSNYSCEVIHAESRFHVEKVWDPDSGLKGRIISSTFVDIIKTSRPRVLVSVDNEVQANITLTCLAEGFYPRNIILNIKRNGNILTREDRVDSSGVCPHEDNTFQRRDHIIISKSDRSNYSCEVIHAASDSHEEKVWDKDGDSGHKSAIIIAAVIVVLVVVLAPFVVVVLDLVVLYLRGDLGDKRGRYSGVPQDVEASPPESDKTGESQQSLTGDTDFQNSASAGSGDSDNDDTSNNVETEELQNTNVQDQRTPSEPSNPSTKTMKMWMRPNETLRRDPTNIYKTRIINYLQQLEKEKAIDRLLYYRLYPGEATPCIYGLPKIHKEGAPLRPIVSSINSVTYNTAKHLASILSPLVGNTPHHIVNSRDFVNKVKDVAAIVSYDVTSLFTCIPTREATDVVRKRLQKDDTLASRTNLTPEQVCVLLDLCLTTTYFQFNGGFYRQKHGCAMGSPVSPIETEILAEIAS
ncbi:uncharacterized protein LOC124999687 isoform X3 [Mugil cephalus]|uniref:uncharacterized protein LOC124999687 isoform X3 n=1 Tax=Mugil cephalus TaxID=48193 RepID=UPI001FB59CD3|nr:uncharacterized protein LOC124999687 isoform X3 [Mugil cephalus]